ncbi:MAG TPA: hypothetical protein DHV96_10020 [Lachnospiraceae bacterium]|nr:hypothetical protein [Lachnospiraceae bacterium]
MGLKNYNEQVAVIKQADRQVEKLKSYANSMNALIISLQSLWDDNADQGTMLNAIGDCVYEAAGIYYDYNLFSVNAIRWLKNMDDLEKLTFSMVTGNTGKIQPFRSNYTGTSISAKRNRIHVNLKDLKDFAQQVNGYNKTLDSIQAKTSGINNQIDKLILNKFASRYSLTNINRRIEKLKTHNAQVAKALSTIGEAYEAAENELKKYAEMMDFSAMSSGQVNGQIQKAATGAGGTKTKVQDKKTTDGSPESGKQENVNSTEVGIISTLAGQEQILEYLNQRNSQLRTQGEDLNHHCTRHTAEKLATVGINVTSYGNGNTWYQNLKDGKWSADGNVSVNAYDGDSIWDGLNSGQIKQPIYNIVISYSKPNDAWGHVLMIDAIVDGKVYYSDNWKTPYASYRGQPVVVDINQFRNIYSRNCGYTQQGAVHFVNNK